jgi:glycosyltransferase involved in cell wall biosynthesis
MAFRFHMLTPPHTIANDDYMACAYTQKARKLTTMLKSLGHTVFFYGHERSAVDADELVAVTTQRDLDAAYPGFDFRRETFKFNVEDSCYRTYFRNAIGEIWKRKEPLDFILATWGAGNKPVCDAHPDLISVEPGCGYAGGYFARWKVFESYALLSAYQGLTAVGEAGHSSNYDVCIPNFFDVSQFDYQLVKKDYFLFVGRLGTGKGLHIVMQLAEKLGFRLIVAGQGSLSDAGYGGNGQPPVPGNVEFVGYADVEMRRRLMADAKGVFVLSQFNEPFGGVQIEAMLSGTPIITSDWGVFPETNLHGLTGFRCRTFADMLWAARNIDRIRPEACRQWAEANYSMERVSLMYDRYFRDVMDVYAGAGWYEPHPDRTDLDWLTRRYPQRLDGSLAVRNAAE